MPVRSSPPARGRSLALVMVALTLALVAAGIQGACGALGLPLGHPVALLASPSSRC